MRATNKNMRAAYMVISAYTILNGDKLSILGLTKQIVF